MRTCLPPESIAFLTDLAAHNERAWFDENRKRYETALKRPARELIAAINEGLAELAPDFVTPPNKAISRIHRDVRFSKDKTPYHTHVWAAFHDQTADRRSGAALYVGIRLDEVGVGAGCWQPPKPAITHLRSHVADHHSELTAVLEPLLDTYGPLRGEAYKRVPAPWPRDHPAAEWLKLKGMHLAATMPPTHATEPDFVPQVLEHFSRLLPFVAFVARGLRG